MMFKVIVDVRYTKRLDPVPLARAVSYEATYPIEGEGSAVEMLLMPYFEFGSVHVRFDLGGIHDGKPNLTELVSHIEADLEKRKAERAEAEVRQMHGTALDENEQRDLADRLVSWLRGDCEDDPIGIPWGISIPWGNATLRPFALQACVNMVQVSLKHCEHRRLEPRPALYHLVRRLYGEEVRDELEERISIYLDADISVREARAMEEHLCKERRTQRRGEEIGAWAREHGSERLRGQINLGADGWPLYLHERLQHDFPGFVISRDAAGYDPVPNPSLEAVSGTLFVRDELMMLGIAENMGDANGMVGIRSTLLEDDLYSGDTVTAEYIVIEGYRPGSDVFGTYTAARAV